MDHRVFRANARLPPDLIDDFLWLQKSYEQSQEDYLRRTPPFMRLVNLIKQNCRVARVDGWKQIDNVWVWRDVVVFELERAAWDDVPGSNQWLAYLRKMYVVDEQRSRGYGSEFLELLKDWCRDACTAVCLVSSPFGFAKDSFSNGAFFLQDVDAVLSLWESGSFQPGFGQEWLRNWYSQRGLRNCWLLDDHFFGFKSAVHDLDQFIFIPESLDVSAKEAASHRLICEPSAESLRQS
jgi:GNAT superfamily N-acetyltransferase